MVVTHTRRRHLPKLISMSDERARKSIGLVVLKGRRARAAIAARNAPSFPSRPPVLYFFERSEEDPFKVQNARRKASGSLFLSLLSFALGPGLIWRTIPRKSHFFADHFPPKFCQKKFANLIKNVRNFFLHFSLKLCWFGPICKYVMKKYAFYQFLHQGWSLFPSNRGIFVKKNIFQKNFKKKIFDFFLRIFFEFCGNFVSRLY